MSTQQDIYATGFETRPLMLNRENYVPWSSRLLRYAKSRSNEKLIYNSIMIGPYVRRMILEPGDADREVPVNRTFHEQTDDELIEKELKHIEADDQAIQTILLGLPEEIYATKKAKLFNEWEMFTSTDGESIKSYYPRFSKLMNDFKRNKHFPEKIANNLKFLNNLQLEWSRHVTIVHQTKDLHTTDYTQWYDFLKYNQKVDDLRAERLAKTHDPLALMANSKNPFNYLVFHPDQPSSSTYMQQPQSNNNYNPQPSFNQNYMQQSMPNPEDITDPTTVMNMTLVLMAKAFKLNYSTSATNNQIILSNPRNRKIAQPGMNMGQDRQMQMIGDNGRNQFRQYVRQNVGNQNGYNAVQNVKNQNPNGNGNVVVKWAEGNANRNNDLNEIEEVNANCILMANLQQASTSGTQTDKAPVYDSDGSAEVSAAAYITMSYDKELAIPEQTATVIIMAQQQHAADVHPDELCPPNKRYDLMDANKKIDFEQVQSLQLLHQKELSLTLDDFRTIFHLPQANANNHDRFVSPPSFLDMVPFYKNERGFTMDLKTSSSFKTTGLLQPWQTLCKIFSKCLTTRVTGWDQPPLQIMRARDKYHNLNDDDVIKNIFNSGRYKDNVGMKIPAWMISEEMKHTEHYRMYAEVFRIDVPLIQPQPTESTQEMHRTSSAPRSPNPNMDAGVSSALKRSTVIHFHIPQRRCTRLTPLDLVPPIDKADEMILQDKLHVSLAEHKSREEQEARENVELVNEHLASVEIEKMRREKGKIIEESRSIPIRYPRIHTDLVSLDTEKLQELTVTDTTPTPSSSSSNTKLSTTNQLLSLFKAKPAHFKRYKSFFQEFQGRYGYLFEHLKARFLSRKSFDTLDDHLQEVMVESLPTMVDKHIKEQVKTQVPKQVKVQVPERGKLQAEISSQIQKAIDTNIPSLVDAFVRSYLSGHILLVHPAQPQTTSIPEQQYQPYLSMKADPQLQQQDIAIWLALQMKFEIL
ncbi:hypothetical protein Tco_0870057 [Tanacetum coccineum]